MKNEEIIIKNFIKFKTANGLSEATISSYCYALKDYWQWLIKNKIEAIDDKTIEDYFIYLRKKKYSTDTLRDKYAVLHAYYQYAVDTGYYKESPVKIKKPKKDNKVVRCFTEDEICKILKYFSVCEDFIKLRDYAVVIMLLSTGLRRSELLSISDVSDNQVVVVGKGNKQRIVPLSAALKTILKRYIIERNKIAICPNLIISRAGTPLTKNGLRAIFTRLAIKTGIGGKRFSPHTFRHTYATMSISNGMPLHILQALLGHSDISTTAIYLHLADKTAQEINNKTNPLNNFKIFL